jgi:hypothetical protein
MVFRQTIQISQALFLPLSSIRGSRIKDNEYDRSRKEMVEKEKHYSASFGRNSHFRWHHYDYQFHQTRSPFAWGIGQQGERVAFHQNKPGSDRADARELAAQ